MIALPIPPAHRPRAACLAATGIGVGLRLARYAQLRGYWGDEAFLLLNVLKLPPAQLFHGPLNAVPASQVAPPAFTFALRGLAHALGPSEWAMRLLPLLASLATLLLMARLFRRIAPSGYVAAGATFLWSLSEPLIYQSANVKQYSTDALITALLLIIASAPRSAGQRMNWMSALAPALALFSFPAIFPFGGVMLALAFEARRESRRTKDIIQSLLGSAVCVCALLWLTANKMAAPDLANYWSSAFPDYHHPAKAVLWPLVKLYAFIDYPLKPLGFVLAAPLALAACRWRSLPPLHRQALFIFALSTSLALLAAALHAYPFDGTRTTLYLLPAMFAAVCAGLSTLPPRWAVGIVALGTVGAAFAFANDLAHPFATRDVRPALRFVDTHRPPDEPILVTPTSGPIVEVTWWGHDHGTVIYTRTRNVDRPTGSFWVVGCYDRFGKLKDEDVPFLTGLGESDPSSSAERPGWLARHYPAPHSTP